MRQGDHPVHRAVDKTLVHSCALVLCWSPTEQRRPGTERDTVMQHQWSLKLEVEHDVARRRAVMLHSLKELVDSSSGDAVAVAAIQTGGV